MGPMGLRGERGERGEKGETGPAGTSGQRGERGPTGPRASPWDFLEPTPTPAPAPALERVVVRQDREAYHSQQHRTSLRSDGPRVVGPDSIIVGAGGGGSRVSPVSQAPSPTSTRQHWPGHGSTINSTRPPMTERERDIIPSEDRHSMVIRQQDDYLRSRNRQPPSPRSSGSRLSGGSNRSSGNRGSGHNLPLPLPVGGPPESGVRIIPAPPVIQQQQQQQVSRPTPRAPSPPQQTPVHVVQLPPPAHHPSVQPLASPTRYEPPRCESSTSSASSISSRRSTRSAASSSSSKGSSKSKVRFSLPVQITQSATASRA